MKKFSNVKGIALDAHFRGVGCVNYDSKEQASFIRFNTNLYSGDALKHNNVVLAKKQFYTAGISENGKTMYTFKYKVSSDCLKSDIFKDTVPYQNPSIANLDCVLYNAIANPGMLTRGYMFTSQVGNTLRKKSALTLTDAVEIGPERTSFNLDIHSRSGQKKEKENENDPGDNSMFYRETVGELDYKADGGIDLEELQFVPADVMYDRMAVELDGGEKQKIYFDALRRNLVNFEPEVKPYYIPNTYVEDNCPEQGVLLNKESVDFLVKRLLKRILSVNIVRRDAYFKSSGLKVSIITDEGKFTENITLDNIDDFYFEYSQKYFEADKEKYTKIMADAKIVEEAKKNKKEAKKKKSKKTDASEIEAE